MKPWLWTVAAGVTALGITAAAPARADVGKIAFISNRDGNQEIYVMNPDGTGQTNITNTSGVSEEFPTWNATGTKISYNRSNEIWTTNANGSGAALVIGGNGGERRDAVYKPGSNFLSYSRYTGDWNTNLIDLSGANETSLINHPLGPYAAHWNPDGTKIAFHAFNNFGNYDPRIYTRNPDGSGEVLLTPTNGNRDPSWSPDGARIIFQSSRDGNNEIYVMNADGSNQTRLTNNTSSDVTPVFNPDGSKIAFISDRDGNNEVYVMNADGSGQTRITNNSSSEIYPTWQQTLAANAPSVSIDNVSVTEGDTGTTNASFNVSLSAASTNAVTVSYRTYDGTAVAGQDYTAVPSTSIIFSPGQTSKTILIPVKGDTLDEVDETFSVRLFAEGATVAKQEGVATIVDNDPLPGLSVGDVSVTEGNTGTVTANFTVSLGAASAKTVTFNYATANGDATAGSDYTAASGIATIAAGQTSVVIPVSVRGDTILEKDEQFLLNLTTPTNATLTDGQGIATIVNDDTMPGLAISNATVAEGGAASFTLTLSQAGSLDATVNYATADGSALAGSDYTTKSGAVTIPAGQTTATISIATINDTVLENDETFFVNLSGAVNASLTGAQGTGTITSDDVPELFVSDVSIREGNSGMRNLYFTVALSEPAPFTVKTNYATADGVATAGSDYTATSGIFSFAPGEISKSLAVAVKGDLVFESDEVFYVNLSSPTNATLAVAQGKGTLLNDEGTPKLSVNDVTVAEGNSGTANMVFTLTLFPASEGPVSVDVATADGTAQSGSDYTARSTTTINFAAGETTKTVTIPIVGDLVAESDETVLLNLSNAVGASVSIGDAQGVGTIANDDFTPENISVVHPGGSPVGTSAAGVSHTLTATYSDANGAADIRTARIIVCAGPTATTVNSLCGYYDVATNKLYLHSGTAGGALMGGFAPGSNNTIANSQGTLDCSTTTVTRTGNVMTIRWAFTPSAAFTGTKNLFLLVSDLRQSDGWDDLGDWTIGAAAAIKPPSGSGS